MLPVCNEQTELFYRPGVECLAAGRCTDPKTLGGFSTGRSRARFAARRETLVHGPSLALSDVLLYLFDQVIAGPARREVLDHLLVPLVVVEFVEPRGKRMTLVLRQFG